MFLLITNAILKYFPEAQRYFFGNFITFTNINITTMEKLLKKLLRFVPGKASRMRIWRTISI